MPAEWMYPNMKPLGVARDTRLLRQGDSQDKADWGKSALRLDQCGKWLRACSKTPESSSLIDLT